MTTSAVKFFEEFATPRDVPALADVRGSYRFDVTGVGTWVLHIECGKVSATAGASEADIVFKGDEADVVGVLEGKKHMLTTFMQGRFGAAGNLLKLPAFFGGLRAAGGLKAAAQAAKEGVS